MSTINVTQSSELMRNHSSGRVVDARGGGAVAAVCDARGDLATLALSPAGSLFLIRRSAATLTGWTQSDITPAAAVIERFDAAQNAAGDIVLYAVAKGALHFATLQAAALDDDATLAQSWTRHPFELRGHVRFLRIGAPEEGAEAAAQPLVIVMVEEAGEIRRHVLNAERDLKPFPNDVTEVYDAVPGRLRVKGHLHRGVYALFRTKAGETAAGFVGYAAGVEKAYQFVLAPGLLPANARALATLANGGETDLYVGGDGIVRVEAAQQKSFSPAADVVASAETVRGVAPRSLWVRGGEEPSVWALGAGKTLFRVRRERDKWGYATRMQNGAVAVAPIRNTGKKADEMVVTLDGGRLLHEWLDPAGSGWSDHEIAVSDDRKLQSFDCYTTTLSIADEHGPAVGRTFTIEASEWSDATINGMAAVLDRQGVAVKTDALGQLTIVQKTATLAAPVLKLLDGTKKLAEIDAAKNVRGKLQKVKSAGDLRVTLPGGEPLFPKAKDGDLAAAAASLGELTTLAGKLPPNGDRQAAAVTASLASPAESAAWGLRFHPDGRVELLSAADAAEVFADAARNAETAPAWDFWALAADALRIIRNTIDHIVTVVFKVADSIVTIGKAVIHFAVETIGQVVSAMHTVIEKLGAEMNKLVQWLGFVFDWNDVVTTHKVLVNLFDRSCDYGLASLDGARKQVGALFDTLQKQVDALQLPAGIAGAEIFGRAEAAAAQHDPGRKTTQFLTTSPAANFASYHLLHSGGGTSLFAAEVNVEEIGKDVVDFINDVLTPERRKALGDTMTGLIDGAGKMLRGGRVTIGELFEAVKSLLRIPLEISRLVVDGLMAFAKRLLQVVIDTLRKPLDVPFLTSFYDAFAGNTDGRRPCNLINVLLLLAAVPANAAYKAVTGRAPFPDGRTYGLDTATVQQIFGPRAAEGDVEKGLRIYEIVGSFIRPWATMLSRVLGAAETLMKKPPFFLSVASVATMEVIMAVSMPLSTPRNFELGNFMTWAGWGLDFAAPVFAILGVVLPDVLRNLVNFIGMQAGFFIGVVATVTTAKNTPTGIAAAILAVADTFVGYAADVATLLLSVDSAEIKVAAAGTMAAGTHLSPLLGTVGAIMAAIADPPLLEVAPGF